MPKGVEHDENLLGYLLDALDRDARRAVDAHLRLHPEARRRLGELQQLLAPLADDDETPEPPPGLAASALARIAEHHNGRLPAAPPPSPRQVGAPVRRNLRRADLVVVALMLFLTAGLLMAWLARQWRDYRVLACQNNLRQFWTALQLYADQHPAGGGAFPRVESEPPRNFAGVFVPVLADAGALGGDVSAACPARSLATPASACSLAALEEASRCRPDEFHALTRDLGGDYAYSLGYRQGDDLDGLTRDCGDLAPILADRPQPAGRGNSPNHGGAGQNVLYIGGQVRWCVEPTVGVDRDDIYVNLNRQVLAGGRQTDTVLGSSEAAPCLGP